MALSAELALVARSSARFRVVHRTHYQYALPVEICHSEAHLKPRSTPRQRCIATVLDFDPAPDVERDRLDYFGNVVTYFAAQLPGARLVVVATSEVEVTTPAEGEPSESPPWEEARAEIRAGLDRELLLARELALDSPLVAASPELHEYAAPSFPPGRPLHQAVADLTRRIHRDFAYDPGTTTVATPPAVALERRRGVCQDFAHVAIGCLRSVGLPGRYISGYLETVPPQGGAVLRGAAASHAWAATFVPGYGWLEIDPTNDQVPPRQHVTVAWGRDYADVAPLKGVLLGGGDHVLEVGVEVERLGVAAA